MGGCRERVWSVWARPVLRRAVAPVSCERCAVRCEPRRARDPRRTRVGRPGGELEETKSAAGTRTVPVLECCRESCVATPAAHRPPTRRARVRPHRLRSVHPDDCRSRALRAWERENDRRVDAADEGAEVELLGYLAARGRHTGASALIAAGANPRVVQTIMGRRGVAFDTLDQSNSRAAWRKRCATRWSRRGTCMRRFVVALRVRRATTPRVSGVSRIRLMLFPRVQPTVACSYER